MWLTDSLTEQQATWFRLVITWRILRLCRMPKSTLPLPDQISWQDGSRVDSTWWGKGEPNDEPTPPGDVLCVFMEPDGRWSDGHCDSYESFSYICQRESDEDGPK